MVDLSYSKIGFVNGCFDILHTGHLRLFEFCRNQCDYLIVGIDSDLMVRSAKGGSRPYNSQDERKYFLENIKGIEEVFVFDSHQALEDKLNKISPDIMFVGSDYRDKKVIGSQFAKELKFFERIDGYSTTKIIQDITSG